MVKLPGLTAEHLIYSVGVSPSIAVVLSKIFQLIMLYGHVPSGFRRSYTVPVPKIKDCRTKSVACDDFRGIAISPIYFPRFLNIVSWTDFTLGFLAATRNLASKKAPV